jgi:hypothetical protein
VLIRCAHTPLCSYTTVLILYTVYSYITVLIHHCAHTVCSYTTVLIHRTHTAQYSYRTHIPYSYTVLTPYSHCTIFIPYSYTVLTPYPHCTYSKINREAEDASQQLAVYKENVMRLTAKSNILPPNWCWSDSAAAATRLVAEAGEAGGKTVTHTALTLYSYCTHTVLILHSHCTHTALTLYSYCAHTVLILHSYCTHTVLILHSHCTHTVLIPHSHCI